MIQIRESSRTKVGTGYERRSQVMARLKCVSVAVVNRVSGLQGYKVRRLDARLRGYEVKRVMPNRRDRGKDSAYREVGKAKNEVGSVEQARRIEICEVRFSEGGRRINLRLGVSIWNEHD